MTVPDAVVALIAAAVPTGVVVYDGIVPTTPAERYVVAYVDPGTLTALSVASVSDDLMVRWQTTTVAPDAAAARWLAARVRDSIVDQKPTVDGWSCGQVSHTYSQTPQRDEAVMERPVVYLVDLYAVRAARVDESSSSSS